MPNGLTNLIAQQTRRAAEALRRSQQRNIPLQDPQLSPPNDSFITTTSTVGQDLSGSLFTSNIGSYNYVIDELGGISSYAALRQQELYEEISSQREIRMYREALELASKKADKLEAQLQDKNNEIKDRDEQIEYLNYCIENDYVLKLDKQDE